MCGLAVPIWQRTYSWFWMWSRIWLWFNLGGSRSDFNTWWLSDLFVWFSFVQQMPKRNLLRWVRSSQARSVRVDCPEKSLILSCFFVYSWQRETAQDFLLLQKIFCCYKLLLGSGSVHEFLPSFGPAAGSGLDLPKVCVRYLLRWISIFY